MGADEIWMVVGLGNPGRQYADDDKALRGPQMTIAKKERKIP